MANLFIMIYIMISNDKKKGAVVRPLASHQCVRVSIPWPSVICGLSLLLLLFSALRFFFGYSGFLLSSKTNYEL